MSMVANAGYNDDLNEWCLLRHDRWKYTLSKDGYINYSVEKWLSRSYKMLKAKLKFDILF